MRSSFHLAAAVVLALAGCTNGALTGPDAGGPGAPDAGTSTPSDAGPPSATDDIAGSWLFEMGAPDDLVICEVTIDSGSFDVVCPSGWDLPKQAGPNCYQTRDDYHLHGTLDDTLGGTVDWIREYQGDGCTAAGFPTGAPVVDLEGTMSAERREPGDDIGFWAVVNGDWSFDYTPVLDPGAGTHCEVSLAAGSFDVHCPDETEEIAPGCSETVGVGLSGAINASSLNGEMFPEWTRSGESCEQLGYPLYERGKGLQLTGTLLPPPG